MTSVKKRKLKDDYNIKDVENIKELEKFIYTNIKTYDEDIKKYSIENLDHFFKEFLGRDKQLEEIKNLSLNSYDRWIEIRDKRRQNNDIFFIRVSGKSGLGKTRFGIEAYKSIDIENKFRIMIDFNSGGGEKLVEYDNDLRLEQILGIRLLARGYFNVSYEAFLRYIQYQKLNIDLTTTTVLKFIEKKIREKKNLDSTTPIFLYLHIDEFQLAFKEMEIVKKMIYTLTSFMMNPGNMFVFPVLTGTSGKEFRLITQPPEHFIPLDFLEEKYAYELLKYNEYDNEERALIKYMGGHPRHLKYLKRAELNNRCIDDENKIDYNRILCEVEDLIKRDNSSFIRDVNGIKNAKELISLSLLGEEVYRVTELPEDFTIGKAEDTGRMLISKTKEGNSIIKFTPLEIFVLSRHLKLGFEMDHFPITWKLFENLVLELEMIRNNIYFQKVSSNKDKVKIKDLYPGIYCWPETLEKEISLKELTIVDETNQFIQRKIFDEKIFVNFDKYFGEIDITDGKYLLKCEKGNAYFNGRIIRRNPDIIFFYKFSYDCSGKLSEERLESWYNNAIESLNELKINFPEYEFIIIYITTQEFLTKGSSTSKSMPERCHNLMFIDDSNIAKFMPGLYMLHPY